MGNGFFLSYLQVKEKPIRLKGGRQQIKDQQMEKAIYDTVIKGTQLQEIVKWCDFQLTQLEKDKEKLKYITQTSSLNLVKSNEAITDEDLVLLVTKTEEAVCSIMTNHNRVIEELLTTLKTIIDFIEENKPK